MNRTGKRRLLKLAELLEKDAKNKKGMKFDLQTVIITSKKQPLENFKPALSCGTTACAMGLAAVSGAFKRAGLSCKVDVDLNEIITTMHGQVRDYDNAAVELFDISMQEANYLFTPAYYQHISRKDGCITYSKVIGAKGELRVAKRIRKLVAGEINLYDPTA